jgi:signal transduction histidine kinase
MDLSNKKRNRIFFLFLFGIGLPSVLLAYLAFRGIQNDQALLEQEKQKEHRRIAELVIESIDENIFEVEQAFRSIISDDHATLIRSLDSLKQQQHIVQEVFYFQDRKEIQLPTAKHLFLPDGGTQITPTPILNPSLAKKVQLAQRFELQQNRYRQALVGYKEAFAKVSDFKLKGELLSAIARVQKKSKLLQDAIKSYKIIAQDFSQVRITGGIPLGLAARLEISSLFLAINDSLNAVKTLIELYKDLMHREWILEKAHYDFFSQLIKESTEKIFTQTSLPSPLKLYQSTFKNLKSEEQRQRISTEKLLIFQESIVRDLQTKVPKNVETFHISANRFTIETGGQTYLVSFLSQNIRNGTQVDGIWGLLFNTDHLKNSLLQQTLNRLVSSEKTGWIIRGRDGTAILKAEKMPEGSITVKANFAGNFPPWSIEFYQQEPPILEAFLTSWRSIYFYMFLLIAGILVFGLTFTIRAIAHELELVKMKSDFVSTISHEFKSPLTSIRQLAEMLKNNRVRSEDRQHRYYDILVEQSERLSLLIDNILDFSKMEEGKKEFLFEETNIGELLQEIVSTIQDRVRHEGFVIQAKMSTPLPCIEIDRTAITQAFNNLIDNAIKYSGKTKKVFVHVFTKDQHLVIAVQDFGIGIKKEELNKVFERFYRGGDELTRTVKGSGLGLTLVKQIVEAHHGTVHVESELGHGSTFSIRLPLQLTENQSKSEN